MKIDVICNIKFELISQGNYPDLQYFHIFLDGDRNGSSKVIEDNEDNNYLFSKYVKDTKIFLDVDFGTSLSILNNLTKNYLDSYIQSVNLKSQADVIITIGAPAILKSKNVDELLYWYSNYEYTLNEPYNALILVEKDENYNIPHIYIHGKSFEGTIAGVKRLANAQNILLDSNRLENIQYNDISFYIDDYDQLGIQVADSLQQIGDNVQFNNAVLEKTVKDIYYDNNYEVAIKPVKTTDDTSYGEETELRIKHINSDFSQAYKNAYGISETPVVLSGGIFSDITTMNTLGLELMEEGYNSWLIEMNGGPESDCVGKEDINECENYEFNDIAYSYWPAAIGGILAYSNQDKVHYVGHSNGGRSALFGLHEYSLSGKDNAGTIWDYETGKWETFDLPSEPVDKMFAVGAPIALNADTRFTQLARLYGNYGTQDIKDENHVYLDQYANPIRSKLYEDMIDFSLNSYYRGTLVALSSFINLLLIQHFQEHGGTPLSQNTMKLYNDLAADNNTQVNLSNVKVNELYMLNTNPTDLIVPYEDAEIVYYQTELIEEENKEIISYTSPIINPIQYWHSGQPTNRDIMNDIVEVLEE